MDKSFIKGYNIGDNITILNAVYHKPRKDPETGRYGKDSIDIIFKDMNTGEKKVQHISEPEYTYWMTNEGVPVDYNKLCIDIKDVHPITCKYNDLKKDIAEKTGNLEFFYDNLKTGNARDNDKLFTIPSVFNADMHIEDFYRFKFNLLYKNEQFKPTKLYFDIETDIKDMKGDFPEPGECPVNAVTLVDDINKKVYTLLLENYDNPLIEEFKKEKGIPEKLKEFVRENVGGWKNEYRYGLDKFEYKIFFYDEEINLIKDTFNVINTVKPDFAIAWNIAFDLPYLIQRIINLGYNPEDIVCHKDFKVKECYYYIDKRADKFEERGDYAQVSSYTVYIDQLITFASRRKGQRSVASFKLDYIGGLFAGVRKLDYSHITTKLAELPYLDYRTFVFYNIMDTIVQLCVEAKVGDIDFAYSKAMVTNTRYAKVHRQTTYLVNRGVRDFREMGYILGNNVNKNNPKTGFPGAFVADPTLVSPNPRKKINDRATMLCDNLDDFDYKALYPSIIDEGNMAPNTQYGKVFFTEPLDPKENRFNNPYFDRTVWFIEDYVSHDRINFCERYLHLAGYLEMYYDIIKYFTTIKAPIMGLYASDCISGKRCMCNIIPNNSNRVMVSIVGNNTAREMCYIQERMSKFEVNNNRVSIY